jgi:CheY-like chemotaxis protein
MLQPEKTVLIVEDSDTDYEIVCWAFRKMPNAPRLLRFSNGELALAYLDGLTSNQAQGPIDYPSLVLIDLNLPGIAGVQVLRQIRNSPGTSSLPIVIFSSSSREGDIEQCYRSGANSYVIKPLKLDDMLQTMEIIVSYWLHCVALPKTTHPRSAKLSS